MRKGVGIARILWYEKTIDVFTTHLVSYGSKVKDNDRIMELKLKWISEFQATENKITRYLQAMETVRINVFSVKLLNQPAYHLG